MYSKEDDIIYGLVRNYIYKQLHICCSIASYIACTILQKIPAYTMFGIAVLDKWYSNI